MKSEIIDNILFEREHPPKLSFLKKSYYILRPFIPLFLRHFLQSKRKIKFEKDWYISDKLIKTLTELYSENEFNSMLKTIWPEGVISPIVLTHDVETSEGVKFIPQVLEIERKYNLKSSWNFVPYLYNIPDSIINLISESGCEIGIHGYNHDGKDYSSKKLFAKRVGLINKAIKKYNVVGYRSPAAHRNIKLMQELDIKYDSSCFDIDPFQPMPGGTHCIWPFRAGKFLELPYTLPQDHVLRIQLGEKDNKTWEQKTKWIMNYRGIILLITHPDYLKSNDNLKLYEEFLIFIKDIKGLWNILPKDLTEYWVNKFGDRNWWE